MLNLILALTVLLLLIIGTERFYKIYLAYKMDKEDMIDTKLAVLKIISKHECFKNNNANSFEDWAAKVLTVLKYRDVTVTPSHDDGGKDATCLDKKGDKVYVECKLWNPDNFEVKVGRPVLQKLVGAMLADNVKKGLVITTSSFSDEARAYVKNLPKDYEITLLDGDELMEKLYKIRKLELEPLLKPVEDTL